MTLKDCLIGFCICIVISCIVIGIGVSLFKPTVKQQAIRLKQPTERILSLSDSIKSLITCLDIKHPDIVYKQILYETGKLDKVSQGMRNNNLLCFSHDGTNVIKFDNWKESLYWYKVKQLKEKPERYADYYQYLKDCWGAPDMKLYISTLKQIK